MTDDHNGLGGQATGGDDLVEIDLNFESMRRFQGEFSPNLSKGGLFIDTGEPLNPGSVVRFRVILPEDFVFLEGTAVVEWIRSAEAIVDGAPGMALRFVTLSSQNQELVEQLVQDFIDTGGTPFDLDVRPVPADFPTDSLEGAPAPSTETLDEGYRLTVRRTGPNLQADALRALAGVIPEGEEDELPTETDVQEMPDTVEPEESDSVEPVAEGAVEIDPSDADEEKAVSVEDVHGFEIVSGAAAEVVPDVEETIADVEAIGDPPEFDWSAELGSSAEPEDLPTVEAPVEAVESEVDRQEDPKEILVAEQEELSFPVEADDEPAESDEVDIATEAVSIPDVLPPPPAFADGPEVIDDVGDGDLGSPAFDVSLPEVDDEPDTTPVLPDEGRDDVTVTTDDDFAEPPRVRRRWPLALVAAFVLAVGGGFLWPHARDWLASRDNTSPQEQVAVESSQVVEEAQVPAGEQPRADSAEIPQPSDLVVDEPPAADDSDAEAVEIEEPETVIGAEPELPQALVQLGSADAVTSIDVERGPSGTVIRIRANGSLEDGILSMETLSSPPRVLVRVRGITSTYRPYTIEAMTPEVAQIRSGLHEERRPSELWVVVDLAEADVAVAGVSIGRDLAELVLARP